VTIVDRIFSMLNRHWIKRERDEGRGWLSSTRDTERLNQKEQDQRVQRELAVWELPEEAKPDSVEWNQALTRAEAGSDPSTVRYISILALGLRHWRLEVFDHVFTEGESSVTFGKDIDASALQRLLGSVKDIGLKVDDPRRRQIEEVLSVLL
jgi:hypothetical protein